MVSLPDRNLSRAVLIGTSKFDRLQDLPAVRNNLSDLRAALTDPDHGILAPENCEVVVNPDSPATFMNRLQQTVNRTNDFLLVYYAGHGVRHDTRDELFLTLPGTDTDALYGTAVEFRWVREVLEHSPARAGLLVLDCCYSGMALGTMSAPDTREIEVRGSAVLASSPKNRKSHSPEGHRHTAFTGKVIDLLQSGSPVAGEPLTVSTLYKRVSVALVNEQFPKPTLRAIDTSGDLLVRRFEIPHRPMAAPVARPPVSQPPPAARQVDPPTVHNIPPISRPEPAIPPAAAPRPATVGMVILLGVLWAWVGVFLCIGLSGLIGVAFGDPRAGTTSDGTYVGIGFGLLPIGGVPLLALRRRWRDRIRARGCRCWRGRWRGGLSPPSGRLSFGCLIMIGFLSPTRRSSTAGSVVMGRASIVTSMAHLTIAFGYPLIRWWQAQQKSRH